MQGDFGMDGLVVDWRLDLMVTREVMHRRQDRGRIADVQQGIWRLDAKMGLRCRLIADVSSGDYLSQA